MKIFRHILRTLRPFFSSLSLVHVIHLEMNRSLACSPPLLPFHCALNRVFQDRTMWVTLGCTWSFILFLIKNFCLSTCFCLYSCANVIMGLYKWHVHVALVCFPYLFNNSCSSFGRKHHLFNCFINLESSDLEKKEKGEMN